MDYVQPCKQVKQTNISFINFYHMWFDSLTLTLFAYMKESSLKLFPELRSGAHKRWTKENDSQLLFARQVLEDTPSAEFASGLGLIMQLYFPTTFTFQQPLFNQYQHKLFKRFVLPHAYMNAAVKLQYLIFNCIS